MIFAYGSREFDEAPGMTKFRGLICDGCAKTIVDKGWLDKTRYGFHGEPWE